jgi:DNA-binding NarL/FixJ family response regulator
VEIAIFTFLPVVPTAKISIAKIPARSCTAVFTSISPSLATKPFLPNLKSCTDFSVCFLVDNPSDSVKSPHPLPLSVSREKQRMSRSVATSDSIGVLVADSNRMQAQLLTSALRRHAEFHIDTCMVDTGSILQAVNAKFPRVALVSMSPPAGISETVLTLRQFHLAHPQIPKILLVNSWDRDIVVSAFRSGARGIFSITDANLRLLCRCLLRVAAGQIWASTEQLNCLVDLISEVPSMRVLNASGSPLLTPRESQVVALVAEGLGNRQIARELRLSEHTVKKYLFRIFEKLGISSRVELVLYAVNNGDQRPTEWLPDAGKPPDA